MDIDTYARINETYTLVYDLLDAAAHTTSQLSNPDHHTIPYTKVQNFIFSPHCDKVFLLRTFRFLASWFIIVSGHAINLNLPEALRKARHVFLNLFVDLNCPISEDLYWLHKQPRKKTAAAQWRGTNGVCHS